MSILVSERKILGAFLRAHRERLTPAVAGIQSPGSRRRTPGLRREELAQLSGVSATWYTWIEQGREISVSPFALARLADALHLSQAERLYLFELAGKRDPESVPPPRSDQAPAGLKAVVDAITTPAYALTGLWDVCAWNDGAARLFAGWFGSAERNLLRYVFLDPDAPEFIGDWDTRARRLIAEFRADYGRHLQDRRFMALIEQLRAASAFFDQSWEDQAVLGREGGERRFTHPEFGLRRYRQLTFNLASSPDYRLVTLVATEDVAA